MFKSVFIAVAIVIASPAFVSAQDIFFSFESDSLVSFSSVYSAGASGSVYIFSDGLFGFDSLDLNFTTSDSSLVRFTGGKTFNDAFATLGGTAFDFSEVTIDAGGASGNLFSLGVTQNGINPVISSLGFNPHFNPGVGPNGAVLLARVDFEAFGGFGSSVPFEFALGSQGALEFNPTTTILDPSFGSAYFDPTFPICVGAPELLLGDVNMSGLVSFLDIGPFISVLSSGGYQLEADCDENGVVNFLDITPFVNLLGDQ